MDEITDDEVVLRHIPGGSLWQAPGPRITSANFQLRHDRNETGVSVTRRQITSPQRLLELVGGDPQKGSRVAAVRVGDVRSLGLLVVPKPLPEDPGHAEIQTGQASLDDHACRVAVHGPRVTNVQSGTEGEGASRLLRSISRMALA